MSKLASLKEWYTIPEICEYLSLNLNEEITEPLIYELALNKKINLSLLMPNNTYYAFKFCQVPYELQNIYIPFDYIDPALITEEKKILAEQECENSFLHEGNFYSYDTNYEHIIISGLWDIAISDIENKHSELLTNLHIQSRKNYQSFDIERINLVSVDKQFYASIYEEITLTGRNPHPITWSFENKKMLIVIRKANLDSFINKLNQNNKPQKQIQELEIIEKPMKKNQYNNLVALIGFLLKHRDLIPSRLDDHTVIVDKLLTAFDTHTYKIYGHETLTKVIKDALRLIEERDESTKKSKSN